MVYEKISLSGKVCPGTLRRETPAVSSFESISHKWLCLTIALLNSRTKTCTPVAGRGQPPEATHGLGKCSVGLPRAGEQRGPGVTDKRETCFSLRLRHSFTLSAVIGEHCGPCMSRGDQCKHDFFPLEACSPTGETHTDWSHQ